MTAKLTHFFTLKMEKEDEIKKLLEKYYNRRLAIENSFAYRYNNQIDIRVKNLTIKYTELLTGCV